MDYDRLALVGFVIRKRNTDTRRLVGIADIISARFVDLGNLGVEDVPVYEFVKAFDEFNLSKEFKENIVKSNGGYIIKAMGYLLVAFNADVSCVNINKDNYDECYNINASLFEEDESLAYPHYFYCDKDYQYSGYVCSLNDVYFKIDAITLNTEYSFKPFDLDKENLIKLQTCNEFSGFEPYYLTKDVGDYGFIMDDCENITSTVTDDILNVPDYISELSIGRIDYIKNISTLEIENPNLAIMVFERTEELFELMSGNYDIEKKLDIKHNLSKIVVPREMSALNIGNMILSLYGISISGLHNYKGENTKITNLKTADTKEKMINAIKSGFGIYIVER